MEPIVYSSLYIGLCAAFVLIVLDKYFVPEKVLQYFNSRFTNYADVCFFCWCFWICAALCLLTGEYLAVFGGTIIARFFHTVITKR